MTRRHLQHVGLALLFLLAASGCATRSNAAEDGLPVPQTTSNDAATVETSATARFASVLTVPGAQLIGADVDPHSATTSMGIEVLDGPGPTTLDVFRLFAAAHQDSDGPVHVVVAAVNEDGTAHTTVYAWDGVEHMDRMEGEADRPFGEATLFQSGYIDGVTNQLVQDVAEELTQPPDISPVAHTGE